jgi:iron complex transport system ATP-binding protein
MMAPLAVTSLSLRYGATQILDGINLDLPKGQITAIVGPNACGKSSLLRCMARLQRPSGGDVLLDGQPI